MKCCDYLAVKLDQCIQELVDPNGAMMDWLKSIAKARAKNGGRIAWVSPSLFPVSQHAVIMKKRTVGKKPAMVFSTRTQKTDGLKQQNKIVPNFIHSLDAAHLVLTVNAFVKAVGETVDIGVIHDGFSVHASLVRRLQRTLADTFASMYSQPLLTSFFDQQELNESAEIKPKPIEGDFNIADVRRANYLFC